MKKLIYILLLFTFNLVTAQDDTIRFSNIKNQLEILSVENTGLTENVKTEINVTQITLANFLLAVSEIHKININVAPELQQISIANNFSNVTVADLLVFLCKEHDLVIDFTGNILSIKKYQQPIIDQHELTVKYDPTSNTISIDAKGDKLYEVFRRIMDESSKNLVFTPEMGNEGLTVYFQNIPFDIAMDKMALANRLLMEKTKDDFYVFEKFLIANDKTQVNTIPIRRRTGNLVFNIIDLENKILEVDFVNEPIANIISELGEALEIDVFTSTPLDKAGITSLKAKSISFDAMLTKIFEGQTNAESKPENINDNRRNQNNTIDNDTQKFSFKKEGNIYYFGTEDQLSIRKVDVVFLQYRSIELLSDPESNMYRSSTSKAVFNNLNAVDDNYQNSYNSNRNREQQNNIRRDSGNDDERTSLLSLLPEEILQGLDIKSDYELNSFYVNGPSSKVDKFREFVEKIDKPVPVILIEVMIIEVSKSATIDAGVSWGIGESPAVTQGSIFPETNLTLGSQTVNKIIGSFNDFAGFNLGKVGPNFFATIKAMEANGDIKIRSTPRLATLNSHRANFSNGQTSFYAVTRRNIYGTDNPQTSEITNYLPIEAELGITIKPSVSGNGQILLDISVIQSSFGARVAEDAPPDVNSRSFSSLIRMQDKDIAILGGLEEQMKNNSGSGVPLLSKIPLVKWLFSKRKREAKKAKLTVLIKPTVIY